MENDQNVFYKFRPLKGPTAKKRIREYLIRNTLWYANPKCLNDPLDCAPVVTVDGEHSKTHSLELMRAINSNTGVLSMSKNPISVLQWSYYADGHTGLCFGFNMRHIPDAERYEVKYASDRLNIDHDWILNASPEERTKKMIEAVTTKSYKWEEEDEHRFLKQGSMACEFPASNLVSIYVGCNASQDDLSWLESTVKRSRCEPYLALMTPTSDWSLDIDTCHQDWEELKSKLTKIKI